MTETDVCNMALGMLGHDRVISGDFRTATSTEALRCRLFFDASRRAVLSSDGHHWRFAEDTIKLDLEAPQNPDEYGDLPYLYQLPEDCLNIIRVHRREDDKWPVDFVPSGRYVRCSEERATVIYVRDMKEIADWPQLPLDALCAELAARLAGPMTGNVDKAKAAKQDAKNALRAAQLWNAKQFENPPSRDDRYVISRGCHRGERPNGRR